MEDEMRKITIMGTTHILPKDLINADDIPVLEATVNGERVKVQVEDICGQGYSEGTIKWADAVVYVYDVTDRQSFELTWWLYRYTCELRECKSSDLPFVLVGSTDRVERDNRQVSHNDGRILANRLEAPFFELSVKKEPHMIEEMISATYSTITKVWNEIVNHEDVEPKQLVVEANMTKPLVG